MSDLNDIKVLATDMDGTFIPLAGNEQNRTDLHELQAVLDRNDIALMYVTGRHLELVLDVIHSQGLPSPLWIICDVGASIYQVNDAGDYISLEAYSEHLRQITGEYSRDTLTDQIGDIAGLRAQEDEKQTQFKISYYCDAEQLEEVVMTISSQLERLGAPYRMIASVDPFTGVGLIDLLPSGVSKAYALQWWAAHTQSDNENIVFAGDSGNDMAALTAGYRSIVVGNADDAVIEQVRRAHKSTGLTNRLVVSKSHATSGVLEGLRHYLRE